MSDKKRYVVTLQFYMWQDNDEAVEEKAKEFAKEMDANTDNRCDVIEIVEQEFGTRVCRPVFKTEYLKYIK